MPTPQLSSLYHISLPLDSPLRDWLKLSTTEKEFISVLRELQGIPDSWIRWTEKQAILAQKRSITIHNPIQYRLNILWNGIILLQEAKFLCDITENTLRQNLFSHATVHNIVFQDIYKNIPNQIKLHFKPDELVEMTSNNHPISIKFIESLTFYELTSIIHRYWDKIENPKTKNTKPGFSLCFRNKICCRDKNLFEYDMRVIREHRNAIAHSKKLYAQYEIRNLYKPVSNWLTALDVQLDNRILAYRNKRPRFLEDLSD